MTADMLYDMVVIGGGPAGITAALRARELGATVALVERGALGGTCTNDGCVPTRVLAKAARLMRDTAQFADYGLYAERPTVDFVRMLEHAHQVVSRVQEKKQLLHHLSEMQITAYQHAGSAQFVSPQRIRLANGSELEGRYFVISAGGHSRVLNIPGVEYGLSHSDVWTMTKLPESVAIIGGGATGCQLASIFNAFGTRVTLLDLSPRILPAEDEDVSEVLTAALSNHGVELLLGIQGVRRIEKSDTGLTLVYARGEHEDTRHVETVLFSVGWLGNLEALNLPAAGIAARGAYIEVDDSLRTSVPHIYAAGDITGRMMLVQTASYQGALAVENALLRQDQPDPRHLVPHGGFTDPEYAGVGLTEAEARERGDCAIAIVPYADMDRAVIDGHSSGFCKLIVDRYTRHVIGAHVVGEQAVEVVQIVTAAIAGDMTVEQLAGIEFAYPTYATVIGLAARQISRDLGIVDVYPRWRTLTRQRVAEWERREDSE